MSAEVVERVIDGDSITILSDGTPVPIRLADIDAPELDQPFGPEARDFLQRLVERQNVRIAPLSGDSYRRVVANVYLSDVYVNAELVRHGLAWVRRAYSPSKELIGLEEQARGEKVGLWSDETRVSPWAWRKGERDVPGESRRALKVKCGTKRTCGEMASCDEAFAYFRSCKLSRLDRDGDGIPCESLCRSSR